MSTNYKAASPLPRIGRTTFNAFAAVEAIILVERDRTRNFIDSDNFLRADGLTYAAERAIL